MKYKNLILILFCVIFLIGIVSAAWDFDNVKRYNRENKEMTIKNTFGLGRDLAKITLVNYTGFCFAGDCYMYLDIEILKAELKSLRYYKHYNVHKTSELDRETNYEYYDPSYEYEIQKSESFCNNQTKKNCAKRRTETKYGKWLPYDINTKLPIGKHKLRMKVDVHVGETIEVIPNFYGKDIYEWAAFTGLIRYEYYITNADDGCSASGGSWCGQSFSVGITGNNGSFSVEGVQFRGCWADSHTWYAHIYATPPNLSSCYLNYSFAHGELTETGEGYCNYGWYNMTLTENVTLNKGESYCVILNSSRATEVIIQDDRTSSEYAGGMEINSDDGERTTSDMMFEIWGVAVMPTVTILFPANTTYSETFNDLNYSVSGAEGIDCWYSTDAGATNSTSVVCGINFTGVSQSEGNNTGRVYANSTSGVGSGDITYNLDTLAPTIVVNEPSSIVNYSYLFENITLNWSVTELSLDSVWFNYNGTNVIIYGAENTTTFTIESYANRNLTISANDSAGVENSTFVSWEYKVFENNQTYNETAYETESETFEINITHDGTQAVTATLYYGDQNKGTAIKTEIGDDTLFSKEIDISLLGSAAEKSFFWSIFHGATNVNTTTRNQTLQLISLELCNATFNVAALNFTLFDEGTQVKINSTEHITDFQAGFNYWAGDGAIYKNYSYSLIDNESISNYSFCINPHTIGIRANMASLYGANDYSEREYHLSNSSLSNVTSHIALYVMNSSESIKFTVTVKDGVSALAEAIITVSKFFIGDGIYKTISIRKTDNLGQFIEHLELDRDHRYAIVTEGVLRSTIDKKSACLSAPCEFTLQIDSAQGDIWSPYFDHYADQIASNLSFNATLQLVSYDFVDISGLANYFRLRVDQVRYNESSNTTICDMFSYTSSGSLSCNVTGYSGDFVAKTYLSKSPEKVDQVLTFLISEIKAQLGLISIFFSILIILTLCIAGAVISGGNPSTIIFMFGVSILGLKLMAMLPFSWGVVGLIELLVILIIAKVGT